MRIFIVCVLCFIVMLVGEVSAAPIEIDPKNASVFFQVQHESGYTVGYFNDFAGTVELSDDKTKLASGKVVVQTASVNTRNAVRDEGLRSPLFLDAGKFPQAVYENGSLTIKGVAKPAVFTAQEGSSGKIILRGSFDRNEFAMTYNKPLPQKKKSIGDTVELIIEISQ